MKYLIVLGYRNLDTNEVTYTEGFCTEKINLEAAKALAHQKEIEYLHSLNIPQITKVIAYMICFLHDYTELAIAKALPWEVVYQECIFHKEEYYD